MSTFQQKKQYVQTQVRILPYGSKQAVEEQISQLLHQINSLHPKVEKFVFNDGSAQNLFKLDGTIPINFQGKQYNIPIAIWLPLEFPNRPPMCFVTPTANMHIKLKHPYVDPQGAIYHSYLQYWTGKSFLVELVGMLCSTFGADPPVYSSLQPVNPYQPQVKQVIQQPIQQSSPYSQPYPYNNQQPQGFVAPYGSKPLYPPPPYQMPPSSQPPLSSHSPLLPHSNSLPYSLSQPVQPQPQPQPQLQPQPQPHPQPQPMHSTLPHSNSMLSYTSPPPTIQSSNSTAILTSNVQQQQQSEKEELRKKIELEVRKKLEDVYEKENREIRKCNDKQKELQEHSKKIDEVASELLKEKEILLSNKKDIENKIQILQEWLSINEKQEEKLDIDNVINYTDTWSLQCIKAVSEDSAISDLMLELDRSIENEGIKLDVYLKQIRRLSRDQFMKRALAREVYSHQTLQSQQLNNQQIAPRPYFATNMK